MPRPTRVHDDAGSVCGKCKTYKPYAEYNKKKASVTGYNSICRQCDKTYQNERNWSKLYGITPMEYEAMLSRQQGVCALCFSPPGARALHVDHCHDTGRVRSLLCSSCNGGLGLLKDSPALLRDAARYIEKHSKLNETTP